MGCLGKNSNLTKHVDFITIHILPYWEKIPIDRFNDLLLKNTLLLKIIS